MGNSGSHARCAKLPGARPPRTSAPAGGSRTAARRNSCCASACRPRRRSCRGACVARVACRGCGPGRRWCRSRGQTSRAGLTCGPRVAHDLASTAMRTATPLRTCVRITDCGPSATSVGDLHAAVHRAADACTMASGLRLRAVAARGQPEVAEVGIDVRNLRRRPCAPSGCAASSRRRRRAMPSSSESKRLRRRIRRRSGISAAARRSACSPTPSVCSACRPSARRASG